MSNADRLMELLAPVFGGLEPLIDGAVIDRLIAVLGPLADDDFVCAMVAFDVAREFRGLEGVKTAWSDWLEAYSELVFRIEEVREVGENVLMIVTQVGVTRHDAVEVSQPSAAVWMFRGERLRRVEFHLDRRAAERSAQSAHE
ncbi:MAG TPA: nuclear transport factor 2 family protein [Solirubrobacterales bacterium]